MFLKYCRPTTYFNNAKRMCFPYESESISGVIKKRKNLGFSVCISTFKKSKIFHVYFMYAGFSRQAVLLI